MGIGGVELNRNTGLGLSAVWKPPSWKARFTVTSDRGTEGSLPGSFTPSSDQVEQRLEVSRFCPREASERLRSLHVRCPWSSGLTAARG